MLTIIRHRLLKTYYRSYASVRDSYSQKYIYFGYGANLDPDFFSRRIPEQKLLGVGKLYGYRFAFNLPCEYLGKGYGGIVEEKDAVVYGALYEISERSLKLLDCLEWIHFNFYQRKSLAVDMDGEILKAEVYIPSFPKENLIPSSQYKALLLSGAQKMNMPWSYISWLQACESQDVFHLDHSFNLANPGKKRLLPARFYSCHDKARERLCDLI